VNKCAGYTDVGERHRECTKTIDNKTRCDRCEKKQKSERQRRYYLKHQEELKAYQRVYTRTHRRKEYGFKGQSFRPLKPLGKKGLTHGDLQRATPEKFEKMVGQIRDGTPYAGVK
jgi:hypothetical protein